MRRKERRLRRVEDELRLSHTKSLTKTGGCFIEVQTRKIFERMPAGRWRVLVRCQDRFGAEARACEAEGKKREARLGARSPSGEENRNQSNEIYDM